MKNARQNEILRIIRNKDVQTQEEILTELEKAGFHTTQATISRDIKELHLVKTQTGVGTYHYTSSAVDSSSTDISKLQTIFRQAVISFDAAQNIVVIKSMPGLAPAVCSTIDNMNIRDLVGSLAGDDTGIMIMRSEAAAVRFCEEMHRML